MDKKQIKIEDIVTVAPLESSMSLMSIKQEFLPKGKTSPVISFAAANPDDYDMASETLVRYYMANKPSVKPAHLPIMDVVNAFHAAAPAIQETAPEQPASPQIKAGRLVFDW